MASLFATSGVYVNPDPPHPAEIARQQVETEKDPHRSGMVFCPQRLSHIGVMRCGEYQKAFHCGATCPNKASQRLIEAKARERHPLLEGLALSRSRRDFIP